MVSGRRKVVTWVSVVILSRGMPVRLAVTCMTAVRYEVGLKRPESQRLKGVTSSLDHALSCATRSNMSLYCERRFFVEGHALLSQRHREKGSLPGHWLVAIAWIRSSIDCDMFNWPFMPISFTSRQISKSDFWRVLKLSKK